MKTTILLSTLLTVTSISSARLINGNFSSAKAGSIVHLKSPSYIGKGWYDSNILKQTFVFDQGAATLPSPSVDPAIIGQLFTYEETGERSLNVDLTLIDNNANLDIQIELYGYRQLTGEKSILFANAIQLGRTDPPKSSNYYTVTELANYRHIHAGTLNNGSLVTEHLPFEANSDYAFYGIRIIANRPDANDKILIANLSITPVE